MWMTTDYESLDQNLLSIQRVYQVRSVAFVLMYSR